MSTRPNRPTAGRSRRRFLQSAAAAAVAGSVVGPFVHAADKAGAKTPRVGSGEHTYEADHQWGSLPTNLRWGETHGVAIDREGLIYVKHRTLSAEPMDSIVVFDPAGRFVRSWGKEYHGGGHGIDLRLEGGEEFLYLCDIHRRLVAKTNLKGEQVWKMHYPSEAGVYQRLDQFNPTNVAFAPDGGFYVADGYGSHYIHQYDRDAKWIRTWGGAGKEPGKMQTPHGIWLDNRPGREPAVVVADRANARLQYFSLDGKFRSLVEGLSFPAHFDLRGGEMLVPDLHARVSIFDQQNRLVVHLGYEQAWTDKVLANNFRMRSTPAEWQPGRFIHPHDACYDREGNIFVVEWVPTGRVTKLRHLG